ncbi:flagellar hook protein FlgE [Geothrix sp. PMB-07]|uniref:flagellar hook protein FlgE n=1 Tax=Geothrix sp. PMB-07 TaxID=3068640 RepID=UPI0027419897|nr:flagellar hook protein FlgE [Geothrix sp. PMB-07]WLT32457.1 flagellar hook protein FlgE [Geothrix sp. PMB-07]
MSLYSAFYSGLSGLSTNANALNVIGNNLSNINTVGFKGSSTTFRDIFSTSLGGVSTQGNGNPIQFGLGVQVNSVSQDFSQSSFQSTGNALDMAIQGNGFFTLQTTDGRQVFSRAGNFTRNNGGFLVASDGSNVMGWTRNPATGVVNTSAALAPIAIDAGTTASAFATRTIRTGVNLNASAANGATSSLTTPIQVYDSQGNTQTLTVTYTKTGTNTWSYAVTGPAGATITGANPAGPATGTLTFSASGALQDVNGLGATAGADPTLNIAWGNGSAASSINFALINTDGSANITQYSAASSTSSSFQDGYGAGTLRDLTVDQNGVISGTFTNGQVIALAQVAISTFNNVNGLVQTGNNHWGQSLASGSPTFGLANQGGRGGVLGANLELANVDVAGEFTKLILSQRGYQANSKIVTTTDELLQETLNLKR